ncbi:spore germination protein [Pseudalkalibacillus hwajinpoensis]|uniref:Spore germination protein n=1 Tax=Guptibacillus hwajinpoensis TaxID=208199 RepID=A0A4U1MDI4_9BACL|nr:spore germination protein [Pseudalkalibacillus hwajinpoensis]TKD68803.1 spore germination protein [Pseudalkalibacillus hwajinpoensis]
MFRWFKKTQSPDKLKNLPELIKNLKESGDFFHFESKQHGSSFFLYYFKTLVHETPLNEHILRFLSQEPITSLKDIKDKVPITGIIITEDLKIICEKVMTGYVIVRLNENSVECALIPCQVKKARQVSQPEVEFTVVGSKEAFVESLDTNIHLVRKRLPVHELKAYELTLGKLTNTKVVVMYLEGIANEENVNTVKQRLEDIHVDQVVDSSVIMQLISDNRNSPFPQLVDTERPDRVVSVLCEGKVVILSDGSPQALIGPTTLVEFFSAFEDYFVNWIVASTARLIRFFAILFSILVTPVYVATLTYHYELIPSDLLSTLVSSRQRIPLPPILEALFLELAIELLREAGARLPTKVGQTMGIVGGIVIGTASVEAGLTSNVLLIIVALSALASFTTPVYRMSNTIRLTRFPFLIFAHLWGLLGITLCFSFLIVHLLKLKSLGRPFLEPIYPLRVKDLKDAIIRLPLRFQSTRPVQLQTEDTKRFNIKIHKDKNDFHE